MRSCKVASVSSGKHVDGLLRQDRAVVDLERGDMHGAAGDLDAIRKGITHRVPALERRQQRGVRVDHTTSERVEERLGEDRAEARP